MSVLKRIMVFFLLAILLLGIGVYGFMQTTPFGASVSGSRLARIEQSPNYRDGSFQNLEPTSMAIPARKMASVLYRFINKPATSAPPAPLPSVRTDLKHLADGLPMVVWFGHSSYLLKYQGTTILVDPVFCGYSAPVSFTSKAFAGSNTYGVADMPEIDYLILTHDHYDHLDAETIPKLMPKVKRVYTALGVGAHLERWGVPAEKIVELDWNEHVQAAPDIALTATPARHFSGRGFTRDKTLWASYVLDLHGYRFFLGGDSGYGPHFKQIGAQYGPFDLALLECGQYNEDWALIHMMPEQTAQAAKDLGAKVLLPVHWSKFALALHPWDEPIRRVTAATAQSGQAITTPRIGEPVVLSMPLPNARWWEQVGH